MVVARLGGFGIDIADVDRHIFAEIGQRHRSGNAVVAGDDDAQRLHMAEPGRRHQGADLLAFLGAGVERRWSDYGDDAFDLVGRGAKFAQD